MLVLTRKEGEQIRIGDDVIVKVVRICSGQIKLGIEAPRGVPVYREEVHQREKAAREAAAVKQ